MAGRLLDYVGQGLVADLPVAATMVPLIAAGGLAIYYAQDTQEVYAWDSDAIAWVASSFSDAPSDGTPYARQDAGWVTVTIPTTEVIQDLVAAMCVNGAGITATYDDGAGTITFATTITQYTDEMARDVIGAALVAGAGVTITPNDGADTITVACTITQYTDEMARDAIGAALTNSGLVVVTPNDGADTININVPAAVASDLNTGTDTSKAVTSDAFAGSNAAIRVVQIPVTDPAGAALTVGDGQAYFRIPAAYNGMNLISVAGTVITVSSSGIPTIQIANVTDGVDMLSTKLTIDASETDSITAATAAVIDVTHDDVATADLLRIDVDVAGTGTKGLIVTLGFQLP